MTLGADRAKVVCLQVVNSTVLNRDCGSQTLEWRTLAECGGFPGPDSGPLYEDGRREYRAGSPPRLDPLDNILHILMRTDQDLRLMLCHPAKIYISSVLVSGCSRLLACLHQYVMSRCWLLQHPMSRHYISAIIAVGQAFCRSMGTRPTQCSGELYVCLLLHVCVDHSFCMAAFIGWIEAVYIVRYSH